VARFIHFLQGWIIQNYKFINAVLKSVGDASKTGVLGLQPGGQI
jgi:hypothetical protein